MFLSHLPSTPCPFPNIMSDFLNSNLSPISVVYMCMGISPFTGGMDNLHNGILLKKRGSLTARSYQLSIAFKQLLELECELKCSPDFAGVWNGWEYRIFISKKTKDAEVSDLKTIFLSKVLATFVDQKPQHFCELVKNMTSQIYSILKPTESESALKSGPLLMSCALWFHSIRLEDTE